MPIKWRWKEKNKMNKEFIMPKNERGKDQKEITEVSEDNKAKFDLFKKEADGLEKEQDKAREISWLIDEGGEELIKVYGVEKFTKAISQAKIKEQKRAEAFNSDSNGRTDMYEVVKMLEPNKKERIKLYEEMRKLNENSIKNLDEKNIASGHSEEYLKQKNIELCKAIIDRFESLDRLSDLTLKNLLRVPNESNNWGNGWEYHGFVSFEDIDADNLREELKKHSDNIFDLVADKNNINKEKTMELIMKQLTLVENLAEEIEEIKKRADVEYFKRDNELFRKLEDFSLSKPIIESGKKFVDNNIISLKKNIEENYKNTKKEIFEKTKEQRKLIEEAEKLVLKLPIFR